MQLYDTMREESKLNPGIIDRILPQTLILMRDIKYFLIKPNKCERILFFIFYTSRKFNKLQFPLNKYKELKITWYEYLVSYNVLRKHTKRRYFFCMFIN